MQIDRNRKSGNVYYDRLYSRWAVAIKDSNAYSLCSCGHYADRIDAAYVIVPPSPKNKKGLGAFKYNEWHLHTSLQVACRAFNDLSGLTGKTLEIRCKAKCNTEDTSKIQIWAACFEKDVLQSGVNGDSLTGKTVWSDLSAKIEINTQTTAVLFGVTGPKGSTFYLDEFEILVNGDLYKDFTPRKEPLDDREKNGWTNMFIRSIL